MAGAAVVFRNSRGQWVIAASGKLRGVSTFLAELWAILDGLSLAVQAGYGNICLELDNSQAISLLSHNDVPPSSLSNNIVLNCRKL